VVTYSPLRSAPKPTEDRQQVHPHNVQ
jgi:hypothetical protein